MTPLFINLPSDVQGQIVSFAMQYSVDALVAQAVAQVSSGGQQVTSNNTLVVSPFGVGVMGVSESTAQALGFDAEDQVQNIHAGVAILAALLQNFNGNYPYALAAYVTSSATVFQFNGIPPLAQVQNFVYTVSQLAAKAGSNSVSTAITLKNSSTLDPTRAAVKSATLSTPDIEGRATDKRVQGQQLKPGATEDSIEPILQVPDDSLSNTAWYADTGLVTGNPRIRASVQPVIFTVFFDRNDPSQMLRTVPDVNTGQPIEIQLNTSLTTFEITSKHVYNRTPSRTGMHVTLWGMEPDLISGTGTTGVFMNQFGITDFMSTAGINDDVRQLVNTGLAHGFQKAMNTTIESVVVPSATVSGSEADVLVVTDVPQPTGEVLTFANSGSNVLSDADAQIIKRATINPNEAFRVAAQDAFVEFLKLFQMNGQIWFNSTDYANGTNLGIINGQEQVSPTAWSKKTGTTSFQQHARNNDVMTRGYVSMRYRNNIYLGYFKSLSWTQDAESPFQWKFQFAFQVEKTYTALYVANPTFQLNQNFGPNGAVSLSEGPQVA